MKRELLSILFILLGASLWAQQYTIKGKVTDALTGDPVADVSLLIEGSAFETKTNILGDFILAGDLPAGDQVLIVSKNDYISQRLPIILENNNTLFFEKIPLEIDVTTEQMEIGLITLNDNELSGDDDQASYNISGLLSASNDAFLNAAAFDFSATFFRPRGLDSENGKVLINGVEMNKLYNGRPQWSNWGGLNDVQRNREFSMGISANEYTFGGLAGSTNMVMRASQYRSGGRVSYASANRSYAGRVMGSYSSGLTKSGWSYSFLASRRFGEEGYIDASLYDANSFFASVEKQLGTNHSLNFTAFYTPNRRGSSSPNTQEVFDLKGLKYNSYWGYHYGPKRNSRVKEIKEPVFMLNHYWDISDKTQLNTNVAYQFGTSGRSRLGYDNAPNPDPTYYQKLPSYFIGDPDGANYESAYRAYDEFVSDGQIDWEKIYATNLAYGGTSRYYLYEDRSDDNQLTLNTIITSQLTDNITLNGSVNYRNLLSKNYANMIDLLGGNGYLDIDSFNTGDASQSDLNNPDRVVGEEETFKYNYELEAEVYNAFAQAQFKYNKIDFYLGANVGNTSYLRNGLYRNGNFANSSYGDSEEMTFTNYGVKAGFTYKINGRHLIDVNSAYFTEAPTLRNTFSNSRQNNATVTGLTEESKTTVDASYIYRSPIVKARLTGYYTMIQDASEISFYYADGISGLGRDVTTAFVQEVLTGIDKQHIGGELGVEAQVTSTIKLKAAAAYGEYTYANNPNLYLTSDDFEEELSYGQSSLENYKIAGGPQQALQLGFEYRDPDYWWIGATTNFFSHAYLDISPLTRTQNFYLDTDGVPFNDYNESTAREILRQERFDDYMLVNVVGGKSWRIDNYYVGFFATVNNVLDKKYKTGGFEQGRSANYRSLLEDSSKETRVFGPKYWYGTGTNYYLNFYIRF